MIQTEAEAAKELGAFLDENKSRLKLKEAA
jgi:hypothetical protein